jgi:hypothetical protein
MDGELHTMSARIHIAWWQRAGASRRFDAAAALALMLAIQTGCSSASGDDDSTAMTNTHKGSGGAAAPNTNSSGNAGAHAPAMSMGPGSGGTAAPSTDPGANAGGSKTPPATTGMNADAILRGSCATSTVQSALLPANILFVVDRTGTMACNPPPTTASADCEKTPERADPKMPSKWEITSDALISAMKTLPPTATVGIAYFSNDDGCGVNSQPSVPLAINGDAQQSAMEASLHNVTPGGGTPLVGATILAYKHLHELALDGRITGNEFVVLITDGEESEQCSYAPRCSDAQSCYDLLVDTEVPKAAGAGVGIRTFVIGAPGSEPARTVLSQIAKNGGTGAPDCEPAKGNCHFDMTMGNDFGASLGKALSDIVGQTIQCQLDVPAPADGMTFEPDRVNVVYSPSTGAAEIIPQDTRAACDSGADGWQYNADQTKILLCGARCDRVRTDQGGRVDVVIGCPVQGPD